MQSLPSLSMMVPTLPAHPSTVQSVSLPDSQSAVEYSPPATVLGVPSNHSELPPIMIADDDADDRFLIQRLITRTGAANPLIAFDDGSEVVNYLGGIAAAQPTATHHLPWLLFLDLRMTGLGGFEFLEWARQRKTALSLTIVVLSNSAESADVSRALSLGAHRYLVKYPSIQTFTTIIRSVYPFTLAR